MNPYIPLCVRSNYSLLTGASSLDALIAQAGRFGIPALALTDENNLYGAVPFFSKAQTAGIRPILGAILTGPGGRATLLIRNAKGYANLCTVLSTRHLQPDFSLVDTVAAHQEGLVILTPDPSLARSLVTRIDPGQLGLELRRPASNPALEKDIFAAAQATGIGLVASCDVYFAAGGDFALQEVLTAIRTRNLVTTVQAGARPHRHGYLRTPLEMIRLFDDIPAALAATRAIGESCAFNLLDLAPSFPKLPGDSPAQLHAEARAGLRSRYGRLTGEIQARLAREYALVTRLGFADYFLVVADIVRHARALGTPVAGRGSGASSLLAYALGITNVDPLRYRLPFERFLNEERRDYPDLDLDFCWRLRDEVIEYIFRKYGADHVAMLATYATMQPCLAFREVAKALGIPLDAIQAVLNQLHQSLPREAWGPLPIEPRLLQQALTLARRCEGFPHHLSVHCGGVVITPDPIVLHAPLQRAAKGVVIAQYDKEAAKAVGLIKLDILGNRALSSVAETVRLVQRVTGRNLNPESLPEYDAATARLLAAGDTVGVNQLESPAMRHLLRQLRPACVADLMQALALIRPGAASLGMKEAFIRRARRLESVPPMDRRLKNILRDTHGIMLYEDDALLVAGQLAGLPIAQADRFRRAVTKSLSDQDRRMLSDHFLQSCHAHGVDPDVAVDLWIQMAKFNAYSFCRAHAASYARLAWTNTYLKAHHATEFWVGALNNNEGMYAKWVYVEEAKRSGISIRHPCVNRSGEEFSLEAGALRIGLGQIRELRLRSRELIYRNRPYSGVVDLLQRTPLHRQEVIHLIRAGALDFTGYSRPQLLYEVYRWFAQAHREDAKSLFTERPDPPVQAIPLGLDSELRRRCDEWDLLTLATATHPVSAIRPVLARQGFLPGRYARLHVGRVMRLCGLPAASRLVAAGNGQAMCFLTLSDEDGLLDLVLMPDVFARFRHLLAHLGPGLLWAEGRVESAYDAITIRVSRLGIRDGEQEGPCEVVA